MHGDLRSRLTVLSQGAVPDRTGSRPSGTLPARAPCAVAAVPQSRVAPALSLYYSTDRLMVLEMAVFRIDAGSDVPIYRQLVQQVRRDVMLGRLRPGDQLPSVKEVVDTLSVNPNTVVKAFSELEHQGMSVRRQGAGTV